MSLQDLTHAAKDPAAYDGIFVGSIFAAIGALSLQGWLSVISGVLAIVGLTLGAMLTYVRYRMALVKLRKLERGEDDE